MRRVIELTTLGAIVWLAVLVCAGATGERDAALLEAARRGDIGTVRTLLRQGASVNARNEEALTPLMVAAVAGHVEIVRALLAVRADVSAADAKGLVALHHAAFWGHTVIVQALVAARAECLEIRWPGGTVDVVENLAANGIITVTEGKGVTNRQLIRRPPLPPGN